MNSIEQINVTKTFLPPLEEYLHYLDRIWENAQLTNQGPLLREFEQRVQEYLGVHDFHFVTNGTLALQVALRALGITSGEIITTPFSYVATTSAILWERCDPVFVDIDPGTLCLDADKIEAVITKKTRAIMPVHVFGNACEVEKIEEIAKKHSLKVIYDAAHAFGVEYKGKSLLSYGDISTCSFHATKLFHTIEGGAVIAQDHNVRDKVELIKRFGHEADEHYLLGINAKASEFQAAMGLSNLKYIDEIIEQRRKLHQLYNRLLDDKFHKPKTKEGTKHNYAYYPIVFDNDKDLAKTIKRLNLKKIFPRRYFYPSLNELPYLKNRQQCPVSEDISKRILCLPLYFGLQEENVNRICEVLNQ